MASSRSSHSPTAVRCSPVSAEGMGENMLLDDDDARSTGVGGSSGESVLSS